MHKYIKTIFIVLLILIISGCSTNEEIIIEETSTKDFTPKKEIKLEKKSVKAEYLYSNGIEASSVERSVKSSKGDIQCSVIQISGLKNKAIEKKINDSIINYMEECIRNCMEKTSYNKIIYAYSDVMFNMSNLISVYINVAQDIGYYADGLLLDLTDGERIYLKDLFTAGTDYVSLLNSKVIEGIVGGYFDEGDILAKPFSTIAPDQAFILRNSNLSILFHKGEAGFFSDYQVDVPLVKIDAYMDILDKQEFNKDIFESTDRIIKYNNVFVEQINEKIEIPEGHANLSYPVISGMKDLDIQNRINDFISTSIYDYLNTNVIAVPNPNVTENRESYAELKMDTTFNCYGYLSLSLSVFSNNSAYEYGPAYAACTYDLKTGEPIDPKEIINSYADKNESFKERFTKSILYELDMFYRSSFSDNQTKSNEKVDYSFILENSKINFENRQVNFENCCYGIESCIAVYFDKGLLFEHPAQAQAYFGNALNVSIDSFFRDR